MGKIAFVFPGQGSQYVGMATDIYEKSTESKELIDKCDAVLGVGLSDVMFNGPEEELKKTSITQPAIYLHSIVLEKLIRSVKPDAVAGHSLGEYSALVAAGSLSVEDALKLVRARGEAMLQAGIEKPGTMAAVIGLEPQKVEEACNEASEKGIVQCANFNSPGQIVISGSVDGVHAAMELSKEKGAKMVKELVVSGAFHSPLMASAIEKLSAKLDTTEFNDASIPVYANVTARPVQDKNDIKKLLLEQLSAPVRWEETIINMISDGVTEFIEVGPGKVLQGLIKRIDGSVSISGIDNYEAAERYI